MLYIAKTIEVNCFRTYYQLVFRQNRILSKNRVNLLLLFYPCVQSIFTRSCFKFIEKQVILKSKEFID
jgi:hypothetical protein